MVKYGCPTGTCTSLLTRRLVRVIGMFGWKNPKIWRPPGKNATIVSKEIECRPCNLQTRKEECWNGRPECKSLITVEDILAAIGEVYPANTTS
jgi:ADP-heptose:LPS heptosyltransferase